MILGLSWRLSEVHVKYLTQRWAQLALNKVKLEFDVVNYCLCTWLFLWYMDLRIIYRYCYFSLFIFNILVLLGYSCLWCCVSLRCTAEWFSYTGPCIHSFFRLFSHIDYHGVLGWYFSKILFSAILLSEFSESFTFPLSSHSLSGDIFLNDGKVSVTGRGLPFSSFSESTLWQQIVQLLLFLLQKLQSFLFFLPPLILDVLVKVKKAKIKAT